MRTAVLICPGRGTYTKTELGSLTRFPDRTLLAHFDARRAALNQETVTALDAAPTYSVAKHTRGDNASALIYACTLGDALSLKDIEIAAITGNSMGWYSALACAGALTPENGFEVVNTMGTLMQQSLIGGQIIPQFLSENWLPNPTRKAELLRLAAEINTRPDHTLTLSIDLGGMLVLAGNEPGLKAFEFSVPPEQSRFPMRLPNAACQPRRLPHRAAPVAAQGRAQLPATLFQQPQKPLIDGHGHIWWPGATHIDQLHAYTLGHQVVEPYDFTAAIRTAAREFAPDLFIIAGPGTTLGGAVAQSLILTNHQHIANKQDFQSCQTTNPLVISMGLPEQRMLVT